MAKFNIGDRVRTTRTMGIRNSGETGTVVDTEAGDFWPIRVKFDSKNVNPDGDVHTEDELALVSDGESYTLEEGRKVRIREVADTRIPVKAGSIGWLVTPGGGADLVSAISGGVWVHVPGAISPATGKPLMQGHGFLFQPEALEALPEMVGDDVRTRPDPVEEEAVMREFAAEMGWDEDEDDVTVDDIEDLLNGLFGRKPKAEPEALADWERELIGEEEPDPMLEAAHQIAKLFHAYVDEGLTREEALRLVETSMIHR